MPPKAVIAGHDPQSMPAQVLAWLPLILGLAVLYVPSLYDLFTGIWATDEQLHGPIVLGISLWLLYRNWPAMEQAARGQKTSAWGWPVFIIDPLLQTFQAYRQRRA